MNLRIMKTEKQWYAVYTRPRWEKKVADTLTKKRIENFCPLNKTVRQWADRKKTVLEPLFTSYVFIRATEAEHLAIRQTDGVINFVYWLGSAAVIRSEEIEAIQNFLTDHVEVLLERIPVNVADHVRITDGLLIHREGDVVEVKSKTVKVFLPSLGYSMTAEVSKDRIEVLNYSQGAYTSGSNYVARVG